jgi:hypothetical protein
MFLTDDEVAISVSTVYEIRAGSVNGAFDAAGWANRKTAAG